MGKGMRPEIVQKLLELNRQFYEAQADEFSQTRQTFNPGFETLLAWLPQPCPRLLDVGCGNGRFGAYLQQHQAIAEYVGVDFSGRLLEIAPTLATGTFYARDISQPGCLDGLGQFEAVACLATLHHIPGRTNRVRLLQEMGEHLAADGRLLLSTWQFASSDRQQRKIRAWAEVGLSPEDVEADDYLLTWQRGRFAYRYACQIAEAEMAALATEAGQTILHQFRSDGREGNLSLYTVLGRSGSRDWEIGRLGD
jgi:SAM-dependent methyltransferase